MNVSEQMDRYALLPLAVESELGRCTMPVREILSLAPGSVIKLNKPVGSAVDLLVGGAPFGAGDLVRIGGSIAVRLRSFKSAKGIRTGN